MPFANDKLLKTKYKSKMKLFVVLFGSSKFYSSMMFLSWIIFLS